MKPNPDADNLQVITILHYVLAGIMGMFSLFPVFHVAMGIALVAGAFPEPQNGEPPPAFLGWIFILFPGSMMLAGFSMAALVAYAGRSLQLRTRYMYCIVIAGIESMFMPIGTLLGVFTIVLLMKPNVREMFGVVSQETE